MSCNFLVGLNFIAYKFLARLVGPSLPFISSLCKFNWSHQSIALKNNKSMDAGSKVVDTKSANDASHAARNTCEVRPVTRNMTRASTQNSIEVPSASTPIFGSILLMISSPSLWPMNVPASIEKTLAMLEFRSGSKLSNHKDNLSNTRSASSHEIAQSKLLKDSATSYTFSAMPAVMKSTGSLEEQVMNMSKMIETIMKHIKDQDVLIALLLNQKDCAPEGSL